MSSSQSNTSVLPELGTSSGPTSPIAQIDLYSYDLSYIHGEYVMSGGRVVTSLESTVVKVTASDGVVGYGETCPLGSNYLLAHAAGRQGSARGAWPASCRA